MNDAVADGFAPGSVLIDDNWARDYGTWEFDQARFPNPGEMVEELHALGCQVLLWIVPYVSPDSLQFRTLEQRGWLIRNADGSTAIRRWWNGFSAILDLSNDDVVSWFTSVLDRLVTNIGIDGFKFDGGDTRDFRPDDISQGSYSAVEFTEAWARIAERYPFNELRACWKMGGRPLAQRLQDKPPSWGADGIRSLIPEMIVQGLLGHAFVCPDMIGGGEIEAMGQQVRIDQEFFVRYTQLAAAAPIMQFSVAPQRVLDEKHLNAVSTALEIRKKLQPLLTMLVKHAAVTGEPIIRHMAYHAPGLESVDDQFFLGRDMIVAPMIEQGKDERSVVLPEGRWRSDTGEIVVGPTTVSVPCPLERLPCFERVGAARK